MTLASAWSRALCFFAALACVLHVAAASAQTGVSSGVSGDRVSLPAGPGSLQGIGENASVDVNMGTMSYAVPIDVPAGFGGATPSLSLQYDSGAGSSVVGIGWSLGAPAVERMTYRKLPRYDQGDDFSGDGQLVKLPKTDPPVYRERYEGSFTRYTWHDAGAGAEGYWVAEYADGSSAYFGASHDGQLVPDARESGSHGTFRYHVVDQVDVFGHVLHYEYVKDGYVSLLSRVEYVYVGDAASYWVSFDYEDRADDSGEELLLDAKSGYEEQLSKRLSQISVYARGKRIRRYALGYERYGDSGGFTRLSSVQMYGYADGAYPARFDFGYSRALGGVCVESDCAQPFLVSMGSTGVDLAAGKATLIDLNGDGLPDLVSTPATGNHEIFLSVADEAGASHFADKVVSKTGTTGFQLGTGATQTLDVDGDGLADLLNTKLGKYLKNDGSGDWAGVEPVSDVAGLPDFEADYDPGEEDDQRTIKFIDYDDDKRIDVIRSTQTETDIYRNLGERGFQADPNVQPIGKGFAEDGLDLSDINGDGLLDPVQLTVGTISYRINLGYGQWGDWQKISGLPFTQADIDANRVDLEDINGDALADLVVVNGSTVTYALNRNGARFADVVTLTSADVAGGTLPTRTDTTTVLYADMNGNGSSDVVWVESSGATSYLELFPVRPNLLSRVENNLGQQTVVSYGTSAQHMQEDGGKWAYHMPQPMLVVDSMDVWDELNKVHDVTRYRYHDGYYDGEEKQFRGYERAEIVLDGDDTQEDGLTSNVYEVGAQDRYRKGLLLRSSVESGGRVLRDMENSYEDCPLTGVPSDTELPIRFVCNTASKTTVKEGLAADRWAVIESKSDYDGYGNVIKQSDLGVTSIGGGACGACDGDDDAFGEPCGEQCLGDEQYSETEYVSPDDTGGRWILHAPSRVRGYGRKGGPSTEQSIYYDGEPFVGLPLGSLTTGLVTRTTSAVGDGKVIDGARSRYDADGQLLESLDPLGEPDMPGHRRLYSYDAEDLRVVRTEVPLQDEQGEYSLVQEVSYEPLFDRPSRSTLWQLWVDGEASSAARETRYTYDEFGRLFTLTRPGDTGSKPTEQFSYELGKPATAVRVLMRSESGGDADIEAIECLDGRGRSYQRRMRTSPGHYAVSGFAVYNPNGAATRAYQPYDSDSPDCDLAPPDDVAFTSHHYDATQRLVEATAPDADLYGSASVDRVVYEPLLRRAYDAEDDDPESPFADTPLVTHVDGLGREVGFERFLTADSSETLRVRYDSLGRVRGYVDPAGHEKKQSFDLLGRVIAVEDPNAAAVSSAEYDDAGNLIASTDARGATVRMRYDGLNRRIAGWDDADEDGTRITTTYDRADGCEECSEGAGRVVAVRYPLPGFAGGPGLEQLGYDERDRLVFEAKTLEGFRYAIERSYDNADRMVSIAYPDGRSVDYHYDSASRLSSIPGAVSEIEHDARGLTTRIGFANGTSTTTDYDVLRRRTREQSFRDDDPDTILQGFGYDYSRTGDILEREDLATKSKIGSSAGEYGYDAWHRVLEAKSGDETLSYRYDALDDVLEQSSSKKSSPRNLGDYAYSSKHPNQVVAAGKLELGYDEAGNVVQRGDQTLSWDAFGRLTKVEQGDDELARFAYSGTQYRNIRRDRSGSTTHYVTPDYVVRDGIASLYTRLDGHRISRADSAALATKLFTDLAPKGKPDGKIRAADAWLSYASSQHLIDIKEKAPSDPSKMLASAARRLLLEDGPELTFLYHDQLGSLTLALDEKGAVVGQRAFEPSGLVRSDAFGYVDEHGFTGQEHDASTGLIHFGARELDPITGRWLSIDPLFTTTTAANVGSLGESSTAYAYVGGNWINHTDPTGLKYTKTRPRHGRYAREAEPEGVRLDVSNDYNYVGVQHFRTEMLKPGETMLEAKDYHLRRPGNVEHASTEGGTRQDFRQSLKHTNKAIYIMTPEGKFHIHLHPEVGRIHHSSLSGGADVAAAGTIEIVDGKVTYIDNHSGHYKPEWDHLMQAITELNELGVIHPDAQYRFIDEHGRVDIPRSVGRLIDIRVAPEVGGEAAGDWRAGYANTPIDKIMNSDN